MLPFNIHADYLPKRRESSPRMLQKKLPALKPIIYSIFVYIIYVYLLTLKPFQFSHTFFHQYLNTNRNPFMVFHGGGHPGDVLLNLAMFLPVGFGVGYLLNCLRVKHSLAMFITVGFCFSISFSIEILQLFLPRSFTLADLLANTVGAYGGFRFAHQRNRPAIHQLLHSLYNNRQSFYVKVAVVYGLLCSVSFIMPSYCNSFRNWNLDYPLLIGNEASMDRPWEGEIYRLSIYDRVMAEQEVRQLFNSGLHEPVSERFLEGLLLECTFQDSSVTYKGVLADDLRFSESPTNLKEKRHHRGRLIENNSILETERSASKLLSQLMGTNQFSIVVWFRPSSLTQGGPARIVSSSVNVSRRNFTLGQSGPRINLRVRTPVTGDNGRYISLTSQPVLTDENVQSIAATYHRGEARLFYNGELTQPFTSDTNKFLPFILGFGDHKMGRIACYFMLLFPLGSLAQRTVSGKIEKTISTGVIFFPFALSSLLKMTVLQHSPDIYLLKNCVFISAITVLLNMSYRLVSSKLQAERMA